MSTIIHLNRFILCVILLMCGCIVSANTQATELKTYQPGDWKILLKSSDKKPIIVHFWGFSCTPCLEELPRWGEFVSQFPDLKTVFIQVDDVPPELSIQTLTDAGLARADNRTSTAIFDEYMRFEIDPRWRGELPLTLLISPNGDVKRLRGTVDFKVIQQWLKGF
jgi:thiol-disulfide isomerase/thioredoxin